MKKPKLGRGLHSRTIRWTVSMASIEFGIDARALAKRIRAESVEAGTDGKFSTADICLAIFDQLKVQRTRREKAEADKAEIEAKVAKNSVIPRDDVAKFILETFSPVREQVVAMPGICAANCNPGNPQQARDVLQSWVDGFLRNCKERIPPHVVEDKE